MMQMLSEPKSDASATVAMKRMMGQDTVARFVWDEAKQTHAQTAEPDWSAGRMNRRGEVLLAILAFAYVRGIFHSREIEAELMRNAVAGAYFADAPVTAATLRCFRRRNGPIVKDCVRNVLWRTLRARGNRAAAIGVDAQESHLPAVLSNSVCLRVARSEAEQRIEQAVICDRMDCE
jgi:hypothetical protein